MKKFISFNFSERYKDFSGAHRKMKFIKKIERLLLICGLSLVTLFIGSRIYSVVASRAELKRFQKLQTQQQAQSSSRSVDPLFKLDFSLWSEKRIAAYQQSLAEQFDPAIAVLRIGKVQLEVPVLEGTDDLTLDRGVGHIPGSALPGESGNIGIAGHRDGFFRGLKDVKPGDTIELVGPTRTDQYAVDQILLVRPDDVSVLQPRPVSSLTLVTCYPFYYVGSAPQRFIVQASLTTSLPTLQANEQTSSKPARTALAQSTR
jgi:sortase A